VFVTGYTHDSGTGYDYVTLAYDASTGSKLWSAQYNGPGNGSDAAYALAVSPDGSRLFVTGTSMGKTDPGLRDRRLQHLHWKQAVGRAVQRTTRRV
jgi:hypothetical protein